eukprot:3897000-Rhodomonas_salina.1
MQQERATLVKADARMQQEIGAVETHLNIVVHQLTKLGTQDLDRGDRDNGEAKTEGEGEEPEGGGEAEEAKTEGGGDKAENVGGAGQSLESTDIDSEETPEERDARLEKERRNLESELQFLQRTHHTLMDHLVRTKDAWARLEEMDRKNGRVTVTKDGKHEHATADFVRWHDNMDEKYQLEVADIEFKIAVVKEKSNYIVDKLE